MYVFKTIWANSMNFLGLWAASSVIQYRHWHGS